MTGLASRDHRGVSLAYWVPREPEHDAEADDPATNRQNLGDYLGQAVAAQLAGSGADASNPHRLLTAGSVLHLSQRGDTVWGSGLNAKVSRPITTVMPAVDYRAVRGPLTRAALLLSGADVPDVVGDPVLLLAEAFPEVSDWVADKQRALTVVPNLNELPAYADRDDVVSPLGDPWEVVRAIAGSEFVTGSSLHAIVIADVLGIPARFIMPTRENPWKYFDYLLSTGRRGERLAASVDEALRLGGHAPIDIDLDALRRSFPHDLWDPDHAVAPNDPADEATIVDDVTQLIADEFADVRQPGRGGLAMVDSLVRLLGEPLVRRVAHRVDVERLAPVTAALAEAIGDDRDELTMAENPLITEFVDTIVGDDRARVHRLAFRNATAARTRAEALEPTDHPYIWTLSGIGALPPGLSTATDARVAIVHRWGEEVLSTNRLDVVLDAPDFRWVFRLDARDIPGSAKRFHLRIDWQHEGEWVRGATVSRAPTVSSLPHLATVDGDAFVLSEKAAARRDRWAHDQPRSVERAGSLRGVPTNPWLTNTARPELSVIVTAHDVGDWIDETLLTILDQDVRGMEVIVVNDHSTDITADELGRYADDPRVHVIEPIDRGGANARDVGVAVARGRFLIFADGDDLVPPGAYRSLIDSLDRSGSDLAVGNFTKFSPTEIWRPSGNWGVFDAERTAVSVREVPGLLRGRAVWNKAFRRDFWDRSGITFPEVPRSNDIVPMTRAYLSARTIDVITDDVYIYRDRPGQTSMTSKSRSTTGLLSYLRQELECVRLVGATGDPQLRKTISDLTLVSDGWRHVEKAVGPDTELDPAIVPIVGELLAELPAEAILARRAERHAVLRLIAIGRCDAASDVIRFTDTPETVDEAARAVDGWLDIVEFVPPLTADDDTARQCFIRRVRPGLRKLAALGAGADVSVPRWERAHRLALFDDAGMVEAGVLEFATGVTSDDDLAAANRLVGRRAQDDDGAPTIDDWLLVLARFENQSTEFARRVWVREITPRVNALVDSGAEIEAEQWARLVAGHEASVRRHRNPRVRRAAPAVAVYGSHGPAAVARARRLAADGVTLDRVAIRRRRLVLAGTCPPDVDVRDLTIEGRSEHDAISIRMTPRRGAGRSSGWTASVDLRALPLHELSSLHVEIFGRTLGWHRVPMMPGKYATRGRRVGPAEIIADPELTGAVVVSVVGLPGWRRRVRSLRSRLRLRTRVRRLVGAVRRRLP